MVMVEKVARVICEQKARSWGAADPLEHDHWRRIARAAIEAMREPTPEMVMAGWVGVPAEVPPDYVWRNMISAALTRTP